LRVLKIRNIASIRLNITPAAKYLLIGFALVLASSFHSGKHPYYIGLTEISTKGKPEIQVSVRIFTNDLEDALRKSSGKAIDIINPKNKAETDSILFHYISKHLSVTLNAKLQALHYVGYEKEEESIWTYLEIRNVKPVVIKTMKIENTILYDYFPAQTHIIRVNRFDNTESKKITNPESKAEFSF
jgi:hypothetical protein